MLVNMNTRVVSFFVPSRTGFGAQTISLLSGFITALAFVWVTAAANATDTEPATTSVSSPTIQVLAIGDSLTAGYGLGPGEGFVDQLNAWLDGNLEADVKVVNAGVSGDTSSGGASRLAWTLAGIEGGKPDLVLLELGANDGLRGIDPTLTRENLDRMMETLSSAGIPVLIAGMMAPPNLGPDYAASFNTIYPELAAKYGAALYPFFLDGVAADPDLNQADGIHPTAEGVAIIVSKMGPVVMSLLDPGGGD